MSLDVHSQAATQIKAGKKVEARRLLEPYLKDHLQDIPAWLLEAEAQPNAADKRKILEACLGYNPDAAEVRHSLEALQGGSTPRSAPAGSKSNPVQSDDREKSAPQPVGIRSKIIRLRLILSGALLLAVCLLVWAYLATPRCLPLPGKGACTRVLFIGNSYTYTNDLPLVFAKLALAGGHQVETGMAAEGGWSLNDHLQSTATIKAIQSTKWSFIVLQEQSQIPASVQDRTGSMYPAARSLVHQIEADGATPIFFLTWAHREGWPEEGLPDYDSMQLQIAQGYLGIAKELNVQVAPAGYAWWTTRDQYPEVALWQADGSHPSDEGTYLAACVFYATIFRQSPEGLTYRENLPEQTASLLQRIASATVLTDPQQWNLP
jgi:hypothetical protein